MTGIESTTATTGRSRAWLAGVSVAETISFLGLLIAMLLGSDAGVSATGAVHGVLFLIYMLFVVLAREALGWSWAFSALIIVTGPVGAVVALERLRRDRSSTAPSPQ